MSGALQSSELHYPVVEKEATAIIEAVRKWNHLLSRQHFTLVTDQKSVSFMLGTVANVSKSRTIKFNVGVLNWLLTAAL